MFWKEKIKYLPKSKVEKSRKVLKKRQNLLYFTLFKGWKKMYNVDKQKIRRNTR